MATYVFEELWIGRPVTVAAGKGRKFQDKWNCIVIYSDLATEISDPVSRMQVGQAFATYTGNYIGTGHRDWASAKCVQIVPTCDEESPSSWTITVDFAEADPPVDQEPGKDGGGASPEPADRGVNPEVSYRFEPVYDLKDVNNKPYRNSAKDLLENVPPKFEVITIIKWTRYYDEWSDDLGSAVAGKVNSEIFHSYNGKTLRIVGNPAKLVNEKGRIVWKVDWTLEHKPSKWNPVKVLDIGRQAIPAPTSTVAEKSGVSDKFGRTIAVPCLLDGTGKPLAQNVDPTPLEFDNYEEISFDFLYPP